MDGTILWVAMQCLQPAAMVPIALAQSAAAVVMAIFVSPPHEGSDWGYCPSHLPLSHATDYVAVLCSK